jgi:hypothetical protein
MPEIINRPDVNMAEDWMVLVFLFTLVALAYMRRVHPARISRLWNSVWNIRTMRQAIREEPNTPRANLLFNMSFYLQAALVTYCAIKFTGRSWFSMHGGLFYLILVASFFGIYLIKRIGIRLVKLVADGDYGLGEYEYSVFLINRMLGILMLPLSLFVVYAPIFFLPFLIYSTAGVVLIMLLYRLMRSLMTALETGVTPFYILFYICTLEILPTAIGLRLVLGF